MNSIKSSKFSFTAMRVINLQALAKIPHKKRSRAYLINFHKK
ncbi:hypothetical protein UNSW3_637 [Campylobacter concisus UNSW3]|uniref:Uncharacterized protein n=1 Tax=Campylobacter concisus UNSW3 TaxID=1242966 RepID=U2GDC8_9BACT|nr:hypothetical protein [Campylobacter concisus]ERJ24008.1 hypothetical protein UNSW3_637 [Campylobacter concisus UNSW3]